MSDTENPAADTTTYDVDEPESETVTITETVSETFSEPTGLERVQATHDAVQEAGVLGHVAGGEIRGPGDVPADQSPEGALSSAAAQEPTSEPQEPQEPIDGAEVGNDAGSTDETTSDDTSGTTP